MAVAAQPRRLFAPAGPMEVEQRPERARVVRLPDVQQLVSRRRTPAPRAGRGRAARRRRGCLGSSRIPSACADRGSRRVRRGCRGALTRGQRRPRAARGPHAGTSGRSRRRSGPAAPRCGASRRVDSRPRRSRSRAQSRAARLRATPFPPARARAAAVAREPQQSSLRASPSSPRRTAAAPGCSSCAARSTRSNGLPEQPSVAAASAPTRARPPRSSLHRPRCRALSPLRG